MAWFWLVAFVLGKTQRDRMGSGLNGSSRWFKYLGGEVAGGSQSGLAAWRPWRKEYGRKPSGLGLGLGKWERFSTNRTLACFLICILFFLLIRTKIMIYSFLICGVERGLKG